MQRMRWIKVVLLMTCVMLLAACGNSNNDSPQLSLEMPEVHISTPQTNLQPGEPIVIQAKVTLAGELIEADLVVFEIWEGSDQANSESVEGTRVGIGEYEVVRTFDTPGVYYAISHVDYELFHIMPTLELVVGEGETD